MKERNFVNKKNTIKIVLAMLLLAVVCLSILFFVKFLTNISVGADNPEVWLKGNLEKYINFKISDEYKGTLVQYEIEAGIEQKEEFSPVKENELTISLNQIDGKYPYEVKLIAKSTEMTNGKTENIEENYQYDATTGIVIIETSNVNENGDPINSSKPRQDAKDEYSVICYYDTYTKETEERELNVKVALNASLFEEDKVITQEKEFKGIVSENIGELSSISYDTVDIANGYIKSNIINGTTYTTTYTETQNVTISKKEAQEKIKILENNTFIKESKNENGEEVIEDLGNNGNLVYKSTKIRKQDITKLLGEDGIVEILDVNENIIATIDKNTQFQEDGTVIINYENEPETIIIKTSEIKNEGILKLENSKEIKSTMLNVDAKVKTTGKLVGINENVEIVNDEEVRTDIEKFTNDYENIINIKDAQTNVKMELNTLEWTNKQQNEVTFDVYVNANSINDNMLKNPTIRIELPSEVEKVILGQSSVVYANGLELQQPYLETSENGNIVIAANLVGTQTEYDENTLGLVTDVKISATIILKKDIENTVGNVNLTFTNQYTLDGETEVQTKTNEVQIESYKEENAPTSEDFNTTYTSAITNEATTEEIEGLKLEVAPVRGDTTLSDGDTVYEGEFIKYNIKVTNTTDKKIDNIKVIGTIPDGTVYGELDADYETALGKYEYKYDDTIKEKTIEIGSLEAGKSNSQFYEVKVNDLLDEEESKEIITSIKAYVEDSEFANYEIKNIIEPADVQLFLASRKNVTEGMMTYALTVNSNIEGVAELSIQLPKEFVLGGITNPDGYEVEGNYTIYDIELSEDNIMTTKINLTTEEKEYIIVGTIDSLKAENQTEESKLYLETFAEVSVNNIVYYSNENRIVYKYENVMISMTSNTEGEKVKYEDEIEYKIEIKSIGEKDSYNEYNSVTTVNLKDYLPEKVDPISVTYQNWEIEDIIYDEEKEEYVIEQGYVKIEKTEEINGRTTDKEGNKLPDIDINLFIPFNESVTVTIKCKAGAVEESTKIENTATASGDYILSKTSNTVSHIILPYDYEEEPGTDNPSDPSNPSNPDNPDNPDSPNNNNEKYSISGLAWIDENEDGKRQTNEKLLKGITVMLVDMNNSNAIKAKQVTNSKGEYSFSGLDNGKYIVVFKYDTDIYSLTEYQKNGIITSLNSDAISKEITLLGEKAKVGLTDIISVDASIKNIDIGLVKNKICDLKLDKYISKVIVKTASGTKEQVYDNSKLAKAEIKAKEIKGATVIVEYKLVITNEGEIPTSVNNVIDYLPNGLEFSSELNKSWTMTKNSELSNTSLTNQKIEPGKSKELTLILTKAMTSDSTDTFTNIAEIGEISNSLDRKDIDSEPGNKAENEDDYSKAELIISVSTGAIIYIFTILGILLIIGIIIYLNIRFGIKKITKISMLITISVLTVLGNMRSSFSYNAWSSLPSNAAWYEIGANNDGYAIFSASGIGNGRCAMETFASATGGGLTRELDGKYYSTVYDTKTTKTDDISFKKENTNSDVLVVKSGNKLKIGPFKTSGNPTKYTYRITGENATYSNPTVTNKTTESGITTFYLEIDYVEDSIKKVEITGYKTRTTTTTTYKAAYAYYIPTSSTTGKPGSTYICKLGHTHINWAYEPYWYDYFIQDVMTYDRYMWEEEEEVEETRESTLTWIIQYGNLEITKADSDNSNIKLEGVKIQVRCDTVGYDETFTTDTNGKIFIENLKQGTYTITEISNSHYGYNVMASGTIQLKGGMTNTYTLPNEKQTGNLQIVKKDFHSNKPLQGVSFIIKKIERADINQDGSVDITDVTDLQKYILLGEQDINVEPYGRGDINNDGQINNDDAVLLQEYLAKKTTIGEGYIQAINENGICKEVTGTISLTDMEVTENSKEATIFTTDENGKIEIINMLTGQYIVEEIDVGNDFGYEIDNEYITWNNGSAEGKGANIPITINRQSSTETDEEATATSVKYYNVLDVYNRQKYIKLSGFAWEEKTLDNKQTTQSGEYESDSNDKLLANVRVELYDYNGNMIEYTNTDANGFYIFGEELPDRKKILISDLYDENTKKAGYIQFGYNGLNYQTLDINCIEEKDENGQKKYLKNDDGNTAAEIESSNTDSSVVDIKDQESYTDLREEYNNQWYYIENNIKYPEERTTANGIELSYNSDDYSSTLDYSETNGVYGYDNAKYPIFTNAKERTITGIYNISARTETNTTSTEKSTFKLFGQNRTIDEILTNGEDVIENINLGLYEREQPDIEILKDLYDVRVSVNGYTHIYEAGQAINHLVNNPNDEEAIFNAGIQFPSGKQTDYENISYRRAIYKADYECDVPGKELKVYATYVIKISNKSTNLKVRVNEIMDYYHEAYTFEGIGTGIDSNTKTRDLSGSVKNYTNDDVNKTLSIELDKIISGTALTEEEKQKGESNEINIYIQFSIPKDKLGEFLDEATDDDNGEEYKYVDNLENIAEINSYSVFDENEKIYAGIDEDSNPGNVDKEKLRKEPERRTEDDTSLAPGFRIEVRDSLEREIVGTVFLDESVFEENPDETHTGETRNGDGIYEEELEREISGVKVDLYKSADLEKDSEGNYKIKSGASPVVKTTYTGNQNSTGNDGYFKISGFYPGDYNIVYTWGDKTYIEGNENNPINVNDYKGTIYRESGRVNSKSWYDYKVDTRYSDAMDNYETRKLIDAENSTINLMDSTTPTMRFGIEKGDDLVNLIGITLLGDEIQTFTIPNVDFGITERARQLLDIEKTVDTVKITVGASTIAHGKLIEEDGILKLSEDSSKSLTYIPPSYGQGSGMIKAEIDSELLHGAKAKIQYNISLVNKSEIDYDTKEYYLYGAPGQESDIIKYKATKIYDYLDNSLSYSEGLWEIQTLNETNGIPGYNETVGEKTVTEKYLYKNYLKLSVDSEDYIGYEDFQSQYKDAINNWTQNNVNKAREKRLNGKTILQYNGNIDIVNPGNESDDVAIIVEGELANTQEIDLNNDVEITNVTREGVTGRRITPAALYDRAESVVITSPTGDNQNYILITGIAISFLVTLGTGIIFIKKKVLR